MKNEIKDLDLTISGEKIAAAIEKAINTTLQSDYGNPIKDLVEESIKSNTGQVKEVVDDIIKRAISTDDFKDKMSDVVVQRLIESALKSR